MERFLRKKLMAKNRYLNLKKSSIIDVWQGHKYVSDFVRNKRAWAANESIFTSMGLSRQKLCEFSCSVWLLLYEIFHFIYNLLTSICLEKCNLPKQTN